ncbi:response regulator transcription factor [Priestia taiwanensis]|uniref:DNA-binding response regulator n=1 Tax=Priestia taiwanensis TaxID=1347902 RepID=A0A917AQM7_9BACI|nr:response regulator transcription factor [Priestia taiwanensis]MBM7363127.1 DNA-binding response OmpR family regulator [Priestia taiwanensis]GGE67910.1 DNA-binding response regulator [Priestia taiwanensis]
MGTSILIVDDEKEIGQLISLYLRNEGYTIHMAFDGEEALEIVHREQPTMMILDIMMPRMDGMEVCKCIRESSDMPILMLSAKAEDMDKIMGLMTGADDYMIKPFNPLELVARVKALLRRSNMQRVSNPVVEDTSIYINSLEINKKNHTVTVDGNRIKLTSIEFEILYLLASHPGRVFSSEEIFELVWKDVVCDSNKTVMVHISNIREKLEKALNGEKIIHTVWGVGYKIEK